MMKKWTVAEAIDAIHAARGDGEKSGLDNMRLLCARLGDPQRAMRVIHVAGTNGKGSTCAFLDAMLRAAHYTVGLYTSPYLQRYQERIRINGQPVDDAAFLRAFDAVWAQVEALRAEGIHPTTFEIGTALAFVAFVQAGVQLCVVEVGLGGRLDPTNVVQPVVCAITAIGMDHMQYLGDTIECIAREKAGIIKQGVPVITAPAPRKVAQVFAAVSSEHGARWDELTGDELTPLDEAQTCRLDLDGWVLPRVKLNLAGAHQLDNAATALAVIAELRRQGYEIPDAAALQGLTTVRWPGRLEWIEASPALLLDGAHNAQGAQALAAYIATLPKQARRVLLCGVLAEKVSDEMIAALASLAMQAVATTPGDPRALPAESLASQLAARGMAAESCERPADALVRARELAGPDGLVIVAGSLYLVGAVRALLAEEGVDGL